MTQRKKAAALSPGEIMPGMFVTVLNHKEGFEPSQSRNMFGMVVSSNSRAYMGDVLLVKAVNVPYVAVEDYSDFSGGKPRKAVLDMRLFDFAELDEEFVMATGVDLRTEEEKKRDAKTRVSSNPTGLLLAGTMAVNDGIFLSEKSEIDLLRAHITRLEAELDSKKLDEEDDET